MRRKERKLNKKRRASRSPSHSSTSSSLSSSSYSDSSSSNPAESRTTRKRESTRNKVKHVKKSKRAKSNRSSDRPSRSRRSQSPPPSKSNSSVYPVRKGRSPSHHNRNKSRSRSPVQITVTLPDIKNESTTTKKPLKIVVGMLTPKVTEEHLIEIFGEFGTVMSVSKRTDTARNGFNLAYIEFLTLAETENALRHMDGAQIDGQEVTASPVNDKSPGSTQTQMQSNFEKKVMRRTPAVIARRGECEERVSSPPTNLSSFRARGSANLQPECRSMSPPPRRHKHRHKSSSSPQHITSNNPFQRLSPHVIHYLRGDATTPVGTGKRIIAHICNNAGGWGKGFVLAVSKKWSFPEKEYRRLKTPIDLGRVQFVSVTDELTVANMVAQTSPYDAIPIRYDALRTSLKEVAEYAVELNASVHMPKIGTGLSRGNWDRISEIIMEELVHHRIPVYVYLFE